MLIRSQIYLEWEYLYVYNHSTTSAKYVLISYLTAMKSLRKLNLNSTHLSALTFEGLKVSFLTFRPADFVAKEEKFRLLCNAESCTLYSPQEKLPALQECDVRYTDAWWWSSWRWRSYDNVISSKSINNKDLAIWTTNKHNAYVQPPFRRPPTVVQPDKRTTRWWPFLS